MKKEVLITKGLTEEQANYVLELYNTEIKDYVPKADYDLVNSKVETLENTVNGIWVSIKDAGDVINAGYMVESCTHTFENGRHTMKLELSERSD